MLTMFATQYYLSQQGDKEKLADCYMILGFLQKLGTPDEFEVRKF
jgi:hypothetical protein